MQLDSTSARTARKVAIWYYVEGMGQREIAKRMGISIASVSRALTRAKELGLVRITIVESPSSFQQTEIAMEQKFGLRECLLVPRYDPIEHTYREMAHAVSGLLQRLLKAGSTLGVSWGETLRNIAENLDAASIPVDVVPIVGAMGTVDTGIYPNSIARGFAEKLGGSAYLVNTPAKVDDRKTKESLLNDSNLDQVRMLWDKLEVAVLGVSDLDTNTSAFRYGIFSEAELSELRADGGVCATNFLVLDQNGKALTSPISDRILNLPLSKLKAVRDVIFVAAGDEKVASLRAALRSKIGHYLVTDIACAEALLSESEPATSDRHSSVGRR